jgi:hypothetical protein
MSNKLYGRLPVGMTGHSKKNPNHIVKVVKKPTLKDLQSRKVGNPKGSYYLRNHPETYLKDGGLWLKRTDKKDAKPFRTKAPFKAYEWHIYECIDCRVEFTGELHYLCPECRPNASA